MDINNNIEVIIPSKEYDNMCRKCLVEIRALYPKAKVHFIVDLLPAGDIKQDENCFFIESVNLTLGEKRNLGVNAANSKFIAFIDSDAYPLEGWLENAIRALDSRMDIGIVGGPNAFYPGSTKEEELSFLASKSILIAREETKDQTEVNHVASSNMILRRQEYLEFGGMSKVITTGEDIELCYRYKQKFDKGILFLTNSIVCHKTRGFKGFLRQRYVWGMGVFRVLQEISPGYLQSLIPFIFVLGNIFLHIFMCFAPSLVYLSVVGNGLYLGLVIFETLRVSNSVNTALGIFKYIFLANIFIGIGSLMNLILKDDIKIYRIYNNHE
jgi:cellulose synthase/poly-beta-1,6-N-acetylglucosamine synthase-like glycosyltransferase